MHNHTVKSICFIRLFQTSVVAALILMCLGLLLCSCTQVPVRGRVFYKSINAPLAQATVRIHRKGTEEATLDDGRSIQCIIFTDTLGRFACFRLGDMRFRNGTAYIIDVASSNHKPFQGTFYYPVGKEFLIDLPKVVDPEPPSMDAPSTIVKEDSPPIVTP